MPKIFAFFRLVRWLNLLIIALSMFLFQFCIVRLYLDAADTSPTLTWPYFSLLVLATVLIAAAGNAANDYFDFELDRAYKPDRVIIGRYFSLDTVFGIQLGLNVAGVLCGFFLSYRFGNLRLGYIFLSSAALLWLYAQILKRYILIGNLVVAGLSAFVFVLPVLFEQHLSDFFASEHLLLARSIILTELKWYFLFAFVVSLIREMVKDAEDKEGDAAFGMRSLAVVLPLALVNGLIVLLSLAVMLALAILQFYFWKQGLHGHFWFTLFFVQFQLLINLFLAITARTKADYHNLSVFYKLLMFFGIATLPVFYWFLKHLSN